MSEQGATLQTYNQELVKCLEDLKVRRFEALEVISREEGEKRMLEKNIAILQEKLAVVNNNLKQHKIICESYDHTIKETEKGFKKLLESSQALLSLAQHEANKHETTPNNFR